MSQPATPLALYQQLRSAYGPQPDWWPGAGAFEIAIGAILTQNTRWQQVEKALANLKQAGLLSCAAMLQTPLTTLAELIRPAGYYNLKAVRLHNLCRYWVAAGGFPVLAQSPLQTTRAALLQVNGIGPETADSILLYALQQPVFVIDVYTRRLLMRYGLLQGVANYAALQADMERGLPAEVALYQEFHALIVIHAQQTCTKQPRCTVCALRTACAQQV